MELDELKATWQALDQRLAQNNRLHLQILRQGTLDKARKSLRPLFWGQLTQMLFGLPFVLLASLLWIRSGAIAQPLPWPTLVAGVFVHAYGIATVVLAGCTIGLISTVDYSAPVLSIQKQLGRLRRFYLVNGMIAGLPWWLMWVPVLMVLAGLSGTDLATKAPSLIAIGLGIGIVGLLGTWWFHHWSRNPKRPRLAKAMEDSATGGSLRRAQKLMQELADFEKE